MRSNYIAKADQPAPMKVDPHQAITIGVMIIDHCSSRLNKDIYKSGVNYDLSEHISNSKSRVHKSQICTLP